MEITGKCEEAFKKWFILGYDDTINYLNLEFGESIMPAFYNLPLSFQYGAYVEFFRQAKNKKGVECIVHDFCENCIIGLTTEEAIKDAVKNANKAYNSKNNG